ncbi:MAG: o-succinylbenzoate synthase [Anaerolineales bacterium]|nr:o-succinylbenzoate synthase [Anaerolineales bacterium]
MKIDTVDLIHIKLPYVTPFQTSRWVELDRECVLVRLQADGLTAWGECVAGQNVGYSYETTKTNWHILEDFIVPAVLAADLPDVPQYRAAVAFISGHNMAKAGMELALWDMFGQRQGRSLQSLLGGQGDRVRVGVSVGIQASPEKLVEVVDGYLVQGYQRIKLKIKPGRDVGDTAAVRQAHPRLLLQVDGNSVYRLKDADHLAELDAFDLLLLEQPLAQDDIIDHAKLQPRLKTAVCLDESIHSVEHARWALELGACRIINIKPGRVGGLHEAVRIHDYCRERDVPVWMGGMLETGIGRAGNVAVASLPGFTLPGDISASARYFPEDVVDPAFVLNPDSTLSVPTGPGLGVHVREDVIQRLTLRRQTYRPG